jgi:hypothetical protein
MFHGLHNTFPALTKDEQLQPSRTSLHYACFSRTDECWTKGLVKPVPTLQKHFPAAPPIIEAVADRGEKESPVVGLKV